MAHRENLGKARRKSSARELERKLEHACAPFGGINKTCYYMTDESLKEALDKIIQQEGIPERCFDTGTSWDKAESIRLETERRDRNEVARKQIRLAFIAIAISTLAAVAAWLVLLKGI